MKSATQWAEELTALGLTDPQAVAVFIDGVQFHAAECAAADIARLLRHQGRVLAAKMVEALIEDQKALREKRRSKTEFPALRDAVPLPSLPSGLVVPG